MTQTGMVLLLCLIFLTALTLVGLSASAEAILQIQLTANLQESERAKQTALSALSQAEEWLLKLDGGIPDSCSWVCTGLKIHTQGSMPPNPESMDLAWWQDQGYEAGIDPVSGDRISGHVNDSIHPPYWIIEVIHQDPPGDNGSIYPRAWYRIVARGNGLTRAGLSVVESIVVRSWPPTEIVESSLTPDLCPGSEAATGCGRVSWRELL